MTLSSQLPELLEKLTTLKLTAEESKGGSTTMQNIGRGGSSNDAPTMGLGPIEGELSKLLTLYKALHDSRSLTCWRVNKRSGSPNPCSVVAPFANHAAETFRTASQCLLPIVKERLARMEDPENEQSGEQVSLLFLTWTIDVLMHEICKIRPTMLGT